MASINAGSLQTDYLQLFVTQVQNQNPLEPTKQEDFIQQLAQFSVVEGIESLNSKLEESLATQHVSQAISLVGKGVSYLQADSNTAESGAVEEVIINNDGLFAVVNNQVVPFTQIGSIYDQSLDKT